jgi:putative transposase
MKKTCYSESQIIKVLKKVEGGRTVKAVCREYGIAEETP